MNLPASFTEYTRALLGVEEYEKLVSALQQEPPVSIRLNRLKVHRLKVEMLYRFNLPGLRRESTSMNGSLLHSTRCFMQGVIMCRRLLRCSWNRCSGSMSRSRW